MTQPANPFGNFMAPDQFQGDAALGAMGGPANVNIPPGIAAILAQMKGGGNQGAQNQQPPNNNWWWQFGGDPSLAAQAWGPWAAMLGAGAMANAGMYGGNSVYDMMSQQYSAMNQQNLQWAMSQLAAQTAQNIAQQQYGDPMQAAIHGQDTLAHTLQGMFGNNLGGLGNLPGAIGQGLGGLGGLGLGSGGGSMPQMGFQATNGPQGGSIGGAAAPAPVASAPAMSSSPVPMGLPAQSGPALASTGITPNAISTMGPSSVPGSQSSAGSPVPMSGNPAALANMASLPPNLRGPAKVAYALARGIAGPNAAGAFPGSGVVA